METESQKPEKGGRRPEARSSRTWAACPPPSLATPLLLTYLLTRMYCRSWGLSGKISRRRQPMTRRTTRQTARRTATSTSNRMTRVVSNCCRTALNQDLTTSMQAGYPYVHPTLLLFKLADIHCVSKNIPSIFDCNLKKDYQIIIIFGMHISETTWL